MHIKIRDAVLEDVPAILDIYGYYVENTAVSFEYATPSVPEFQGRMRHITEKFPFLVAELDGVVCGYAYAGALIGRAAADWCCEMTVYLDRRVQKCGLGRRLYAALEERLKVMGVINLYASIACPRADDPYLSTNSADFHAHLGFREVGRFRKCGYKFGRWYDLIWAEKIIGTHEPSPAPVKPYGSL